MEGTRITVENEDGECSVTIHDGDLTLNEFMERLVEPVLLGIGYRQETIDEYWGRE